MACNEILNGAIQVSLRGASVRLDATLAHMVRAVAVVGTPEAMSFLGAAKTELGEGRKLLDVAKLMLPSLALCFAVNEHDTVKAGKSNKLLETTLHALDSLKAADGQIAGSMVMTGLLMGPLAMPAYASAIDCTKGAKEHVDAAIATI